MPKDPSSRDVLQERYRVGRNVRDIREWRDLRQDALGEIVGMSDKQVSRIEVGAHSIGIDHYIRLAKGLRVPLHWLFTADWPQFIDSDATPPAPPARP